MAASCRLHWPNNVFGTLLLLLLEVVVVASAVAAVALKMPTRCNAAIKALLTIVGTLYPSLPRMLPKMKEEDDKKKEKKNNRNCHCTTIGIIIGCNDFGFLAKSKASLSLLAQTRSVRNDFRFYDATCIRDEAVPDFSWTLPRNAAAARSPSPSPFPSPSALLFLAYRISLAKVGSKL